MDAVPGFERLRAVFEQGRAVRKQVRAGGQLLGAMRRDPRIVRDVVAGLTGRASEPAPTASASAAGGAAEAHVPPAGLADYTRAAHARQDLDSAADLVSAYLAGLDRIPQWVTFHAGWRGDPPGQAVGGAQFTQVAKFMGIPADIAWTVAAVTPAGLELHGTGPQGLRLGLWITVVPAAAGSVVYLDAGLAGPPIDGPLGATVTRGLGDALRESLATLPAAVAAAAPQLTGPVVARTPVLHHASGRMLAPNTPVLVGVGQVVNRVQDPAFVDPSELAVRALRRAALDATSPVAAGSSPSAVGTTPGDRSAATASRSAGSGAGASPDHAAATTGPGDDAHVESGSPGADSDAGPAETGVLPEPARRLLAGAQAVFSVAPTSWQYRDLGAIVAAAVGAGEVVTVQSSPFGGDGGQLVINEAAAAIAGGEFEIALVTGAEAGATQAAAQRAGIELAWPAQDSAVAPTRTVGIDKPANNAAETAAGLLAPTTMYALLESANRHRLGRTVSEHARAVAQLWARFSAVAAGNRFAWQPQELTAEQIGTVGPENRMIAAPYPKLECANLTVDMASGLILCSVAAAEAAGIAQDKWVFIHAGASGTDEWFVSERAELAASPAIAALGAAVLGHAGVTIEEVAHVDLYACFPVAVQIAARELGLAAEDPKRSLTVTGGLTFGGGPGNNYGGHAVASLVGRLRAEPGSFGLATSLGWYLTKHAIGVYSTVPPRTGFAHLRPVIEHPPARPARTGYAGPAVVEAYTLPYDRDGVPEAVILSLLTPQGARVLVRGTDSGLLAAATDQDLLGLPVTVDGDQVTVTGQQPVPLPAPPPAPVLVERRGHIMIITINRPQARNAVDLATALGLERAIDAFDADPDARIAILTGAGGYFSAGMDLKAAARGEVPVTEKRGILGIISVPPRKPLIAAVEGPALAGGCELALAADLIVAASDSIFGIPEVKRGLVAIGGGVLRLSQRLPRAVAMELALTGDPITAERAAQIGLINEVAAPGQALDAALALAERIAVNAPLSVDASKQIIEQAPDWSTSEAFARQGQVAAAAVSSEDAGEGMRAFVEKRPPVWKGR
ncbi:crotonase/enoyl-CoA hydratase family protein [Nocardia yamanashiensis]|uniref:crotonase/enoyl-CoA hydratase family protein n=1 Tax=Nocardia yamanashiensis TaxID=209247 RepID=UPI00082A0FB9|nr:crotonase/enoyl-CoA hydratase family protein [Nocardia yamanashiensis]